MQTEVRNLANDFERCRNFAIFMMDTNVSIRSVASVSMLPNQAKTGERQ